jgi:hypothetical protein
MFWSAFQRLYAAMPKEAFGKGSGADWTAGMYKLLHGLRTDFGLHCECRQAHPDQKPTTPGERMHIDFFWYLADSGAWASPVAVIEHENLAEGAMADWWKIAQLAAPLRVFIGYARTQALVERFSYGLQTIAHEERWFLPPGTEDLLIVGDYADCSVFRAWTRSAGAGWTELPDARAPQLAGAIQEFDTARPWTPNDIVLSVDAYAHWREGGALEALRADPGRGSSDHFD